MREKSLTNANNSRPVKIRGGETKVMKKLLSSFLVFALVLTILVPAFASAAPASDVAGTKYESAVNRLMGLKVLSGYPDGSFKPDNTITRAEFAVAAVRLLGLGSAAEVAGGATKFSDMNGYAWASGYVNIAVQQGIVSGYPDGTFKPGNNVTYAEALSILVRALGYDPAVTGEWPSNYIVKATELGLADGVEGVVANAAAPRGVVALFADNALTIPKLVQVGFGDTKEFKVSTNTILNSNLSVASETVFVTATPSVDANLKAGQFLAGSVKYTAASTVNPEDLLGLEVKLFKNSDGDVIFTETKTTEDLVVAVKEIKTVTSDAYGVTKVQVVTTDDETVTYDVFPNSKAVYNLGTSTVSNLITTAKTAGTALGTKDAYDVTLVLKKDATDDELKVKFASGLVFEAPYVLGSNPVINSVNDSVRIGAIALQTDEDTKVESYVIVKNGEVVDVADLAKDDVLFVAKNAGATGDITDDRYYIVATDNRVVGELEYAKPTLSAATELKVDGVVYKKSSFASAFDLASVSIEIEDAVELVLTHDGKVLSVSKKQTNEASQYAVLVNIGSTIDAYNNTSYKAKLVLSNGEKVEYVAVDAAKAYLASKTASDKGTLVKYHVNADGELDNLETAITTTGTGTNGSLETVNGVPVSSDVLVFNVTAANTGATTDAKVELLDWNNVTTNSAASSKYVVKDGEATVVLFNNATFAGEINYGLVTAKYSVKDGYVLDMNTVNGEESFTTVSRSVYANAGALVSYKFDNTGKLGIVTTEGVDATGTIDTVRENRLTLDGTTWYYFAEDMQVFYDKDNDGASVTALTAGELYKDMNVQIYTATIDGAIKVVAIIVTDM